MIEIDNVSKKYQTIPVLKNVNATISQGGVTAIIGPNGAGKSTLLSIISRLLLADEGQVKIQNMDVVNTPSDKLATYLSVLRQENRFTSRLTVFELVGFGRYPYSKGRLNQVIHDINFASVYSDYILAMKDGQLVYQGSPKKIMNSAILEEIFDTPVKIENIHNQNIAIYY